MIKYNKTANEQRRSQGAALAVMPHLNLLCRMIYSIFYIGCYDCAHKNVSRDTLSKFSGYASANEPIRKFFRGGFAYFVTLCQAPDE